ncbi:MAG: bifunctional phosphoglucose/phosphomannose isomerase [Nitrososphaeria archaeon]
MRALKEIVSDEQIKKYDRSNIFDDYRAWPKLALEPFEKSVSAPKVSVFGHIVVCGMGGSAAAGDVLRNWLKKLNVVVVKGYHLPKWVNRGDLVIAMSYSGNTEETLSCYSEALEMKLPLVTVSSGGLLESSSKKKGIPFNKVSSGLAPRAAFPLLFYTLVNILHSLKIVDDIEFKESRSSVEVLSLCSKKIFPEVPINENISKQVASFMFRKYPVIYGGEDISCVVERFRRLVSENGKWHAMADVLPELCHNEIVAYDIPNPQLRIMLLRTKLDPQEIKIRFEVIKEVLLMAKQKVMELFPEGDSLLGNIISYIYFLDVSTIYLAIMNKVEPAKTKNIDYLKMRLEKELKYTDKLSL